MVFATQSLTWKILFQVNNKSYCLIKSIIFIALPKPYLQNRGLKKLFYFQIFKMSESADQNEPPKDVSVICCYWYQMHFIYCRTLTDYLRFYRVHISKACPCNVHSLSIFKIFYWYLYLGYKVLWKVCWKINNVSWNFVVQLR